MKSFAGLFVSSVMVLSLPLVASAGYGWGIYDPVDMQQVSKSSGSHMSSGIADEAGDVEVRVFTYGGGLEETVAGTADNTVFHAWSANLVLLNGYTVDSSGQSHTVQLRQGGIVRHTTNPIIVQ